MKGFAALPQTLNPYPCSVNNPLRFPDPSGMLGEGLADGAAVSAAGEDYYLNARAQKPAGSLPNTGGPGGDFTGCSQPASGGPLPILERGPHYITYQATVAILNPYTYTAIGYAASVTLDRYGNVYMSPIGLTAGRSTLGASGSLMAGTSDQGGQPSEEALEAALSNPLTLSGGGGIGPGINCSWGPGTGWSTELGATTPQAGGTVSTPFQLPGNTGIGW